MTEDELKGVMGAIDKGMTVRVIEGGGQYTFQRVTDPLFIALTYEGGFVGTYTKNTIRNFIRHKERRAVTIEDESTRLKRRPLL